MRRSTRVVSFLIFTLVLLGCQTSRVKFETGALYSSEKNLQQVSGLLFRPAGEGRSPAVVLLHTCGGLQPHVTQDWPAFLTGLGYVVLSAESYSSRGYSRCTDRGSFKGDQARDAFGALDYLASLPFVDGERIAVMGFSAGAIAINEIVIFRSRERTEGLNYKAAISLYGKCSYLLDTYTENDIPLMTIAGELDRNLAGTCQVDSLKNTPIEAHMLKGAYHAFDQPQITNLRNDNAGNPMLYDASKTREARKLTQAFLAKHL